MPTQSMPIGVYVRVPFELSVLRSCWTAEILLQLEETNPVAYSSPELILFRALREVTDYLHHLSQHLNVGGKRNNRINLNFQIRVVLFSETEVGVRGGSFYARRVKGLSFTILVSES